VIKTCTYCGRTGHSAHECPSRVELPLTALGLLWATLLVLLAALAVRLGHA
jgi:Zinc knuckle